MRWLIDPAYLDLVKWDHLGIWMKEVSDDELLTAMLKEAAICNALEAARLAEKLRLATEEVRDRREEEARRSVEVRAEMERIAEASRRAAQIRALMKHGHKRREQRRRPGKRRLKG